MNSPILLGNTNDDNKERKPMFFNNPINHEWYDGYRRDFNKGLINSKERPPNITFDGKSFVSDIKNYLTYGLRDHVINMMIGLVPK